MTAGTLARIERGTHCAVCGRWLRDPESVARGIGPDCWSKALRLQAEHAGETDRCDLPYDPETGDIVCARDDQNMFTLHFNIPMLNWEVKRSGFEWGYSGTGPAAYALNILLINGVALDDCLMGGVYHRFKESYVSSLPREGGTIKGVKIREWIGENIPKRLPITQGGMDFGALDFRDHNPRVTRR